MTMSFFPHGKMISIQHSQGKIMMNLVDELESPGSNFEIQYALPISGETKIRIIDNDPGERQKVMYRPDDDLDDDLYEAPVPEPFDEDEEDIEDDRAGIDDDDLIIFDDEPPIVQDDDGRG